MLPLGAVRSMTYSPPMKAVPPAGTRAGAGRPARAAARTRFPDEPPLEPWATGTSLSYLKDLVGYWQAGFNWRAQEGEAEAGFAQ